MGWKRYFDRTVCIVKGVIMGKAKKITHNLYVGIKSGDVVKVKKVLSDGSENAYVKQYATGVSRNYIIKKTDEQEDYVLFLERIEENERKYKDFMQVFNERKRRLEVGNALKKEHVFLEPAPKLCDKKSKTDKRSKWTTLIEKIIEQSYKRELEKLEQNYHL